MAALDPDNCIKLFRLDDSQDSTDPENVVIIPAGTNILQSIFHSECRGRRQLTTMETNDYTFPDEGVDLLVKFRHELEELFQDCGDILGIAAVLWEDISRRLFDRGFTVTAKQCSAKWEALYSEYLEVARSDDEETVSGSRHFAAFEYFYKIRSKYIDSKILEDITEYLNSRPADCPSASADILVRNDDKVEISSGTNTSKKDLTIGKREFSNLSNEEDSQMLNEAINAAQKILEDNLRDFDDEPSNGTKQEAEDSVENSCWRYENHKQGVKVSGDEGETGLSLAQKKSDNISRGEKLSEKIHHLAADKESEDTSRYQIFMRSEKPDLHWDSDATQCFLDLRLYVESSRDTKQSVLRKYRSIVAFVSKKMALSGYQVSEIDCKKKWEQILRYYNKEVKTMKEKGRDDNQLQGARKYFWQIDKVLKKSGLKMSGDDGENFHWDQQSVKKLIEIRIPMENAFAMFKRYVILWQYVASQMERHNYSLTYTDCSIKWMELCEIYKICLDSMKRGAKEENIHWNFYQDMRRGFEKNAESTETIINYKCSPGPNDATEIQRAIGMESAETSTQSSTSSASFSGSENPTETKFDTLSRLGNSNNKNGTNSQDVETVACSSTLKITIQQCNLVENMINRAESTAKNPVAIVGEPRTSDSPQTNTNTEISTLKDLYSLNIRDDFLVKPVKRETQSTKKLVGTVSLDFRDVFGAKNQLEQTALKAVDNGAKKFKNITRNDPTILGENRGNAEWTEEATVLMIRFKISRELKFTSPLFQEIDLWKEIATDMRSAGHSVSHDSCAARWKQLMAAYKGSPSPENDGIIRPKYWEELKLTELPFTRHTSTVKAAKKSGNVNGINSKAGKFLWTDEAITSLLKFRFSDEIRTLKKYGSPLTKMMHAAGFSTVTHGDVTRKWIGMYHSYRESLFRKETGQTVKWQYFELMDSYIKGLPNGIEPVTQQKQPPFLWTPIAVRKFIDLKLSIENSYRVSDRKGLILLWKKVADAMAAEGFKVTNTECAIEWSFLVKAYMKTKKELTSGNGAVIGKYFIMMDKALNEFHSPNIGVEEVEEPIDFSIVRRKRKLEDGSAEDTAHADQGCSTMTKRMKLSEDQKTVDENMTNLSWKTTVPPLNCSPLDSSSEMTELRKNNIQEKSSADSSPFNSINKKKEVSAILRFELNKSQQEPNVSISKEKCLDCTDIVLGDDDHVDSSKENEACAVKETRNKKSPATSIGKREDMQSRILCNQKPSNIALDDLQLQYPLINFQVLPPNRNNTVIQDRAVNSTENIEGVEMNRKWSIAGTHVLIDLQIKHNEKFTGWPRPEIEWDKVTDQLARLGHYYTSTECRQRWNSLKATYEQKIGETGAKKAVHVWPYFAKIDSIYKKLGNRYHGFRYILPNKRAHDDDQEHSMPRKKLTVPLKPLENCVAPGLLICNTLANILVYQDKMIE